MNNQQSSIETTEKISTLLLCNPHFLSNFNEQYVKGLSLVQWLPEMGMRHQLNAVSAESYDILMVDESCPINYSSFICWLRVLKINGALVLPKSAQANIDAFFERVTEFVELSPLDSGNVLVLAKLPHSRSYEDYEAELEHLISQRAFAKALSLLDKMEILAPLHIHPTMYQAKIYQQLGLVDGVSTVWRLFRQRMTNPNIAVFAALDTIMTGDYHHGFKARQPLISDTFRAKPPPKAEWQPKKWQGQNLLGKHLVIWTEFGLGDELMFSQLAYALKKQLNAQKITLIGQTPIVDLLNTHPDIDVVIDRSKIEVELTDFDYWVFPHDIMAYIDLPFEQVIKRHPYLFIEAADVAQAKNKIMQVKPKTNAVPKGLNVGIVWRGNATHENDAYRSIHQTELLRELFDIEGINWYCLQKECNEQEKLLLAEYNIPNLAENAASLMETGAYLMNMDYLVTVDTSVAHLAGGLGVKTLLLLPFIGDWRWGSDGERNMWYPNLTAIRVESPKASWALAISKTRDKLEILKHSQRMSYL